MMKFFIVLAAIAYTSASPLLGTERCTWGPSYWCSHISHASECHAVSHCIDTVWSKEDVQQTGELCTVCEGVITQVRQMLLNPKLQSFVKNFLKKSCSILPDVEAQQQCNEILTSYYNEVIELIKSKLNPKQICAALKLCASGKAFKDNVLHPKSYLAVQDQDVEAGPSFVCTICKDVLTEAKSLISNNNTQAEVETYIKNNLCARLGSLKEKCDSAVDEYGALIFELLSQELDPEMICHALGICTKVDQGRNIGNAIVDFHRVIMNQQGMKAALTRTQPEIPLKVRTPADVGSVVDLHRAIQAKQQTSVTQKTTEDATCALCEFAMKELDQMLDGKTSIQEIETALDQLCAKLPKTIDAECQKFVLKYTPLILEFLLKELSPSVLCQKIKACPANPSLQKSPVASGITCELCEYVMSQLDSLLTSNATEKEIIQALDKVCNLLPKTVRSECTLYVNAYGADIIKLLVNEIKPEDICLLFGLCKSVAPKPVMQTSNLEAGPQCVLCEFIMSRIDELLLKNSTEEDIVQALEKVCSLLPSTISSECKNFVDSYGAMVIKLLLKELAPNIICRALGLCSSVEVPVDVGQEFCELCKTVMMYINMLLKEKSTVTTIDQAVERVCNFLPTTKKKKVPTATLR